MLLAAAAHTNTGRVRANNEDAVGSVQPTDPAARERKGCLFAVADGLGGLNAGEIASATAIRTLLDEYYAPYNHSRVEPALRHAMDLANLRVHDMAQQHLEHRGMATTLSALALAGATAYLAHVGDSRIYRLRGGSLVQLTQDHSEVADLVRMRLVRPEQVASHPSRNVLSRTLGQHLLTRPDFAREAVRAGDVFLLCSDGVWSELPDPELAALVGDTEPEDTCRAIIDACLARECADNISVQVIRVSEVDATAQQPRHQRPGLLSGIAGRFGR